MASERRSVLIVLSLVIVLNCSGQVGCARLSGSIVYGDGNAVCGPFSADCPCGLDGRTTVIQVKQCPFSTDWGTMCEPCEPLKELCGRLGNCSRCSDINPAALCAECPATRYGMRCQHELACKMPELSLYTKSRPIITDASRKRRRRRSGKGPKETYKLKFSCPDDMILKGPRVIKCKRNGHWNKQPPKCVFPQECPSQVPHIHGARVIEQTRLYVRFACDVGHVNVTEVTEARFQCENGAWVSVSDDGLLKCKLLPECVGYTDYIGARLTQGTADKVTYYHGEHVNYECSPGYRPSYPQHLGFKLTCHYGSWTGTEPECVISGCPKFRVEEGNVTYSPAPANDALYVDIHTVSHVHCKEDRELAPLQRAGNLTCMETGRWEPEIPRCERVCVTGSAVKCPVTNIANASPDTERASILPGEIVRYRCEEGFIRNLSTPTEKICSINGTLTGGDIQCTQFFLPVATCNITKLTIHPQLKIRGDKRADGQPQAVQYKMPEELVFNQTRIVFTGCEHPELYDFVDTESEVRCQGQDTFRFGNETLRFDRDVLPQFPGDRLQPFPGDRLQPFPGDHLLPKCKPRCGIRYPRVTGRVVGGMRTNVSEWPWQAGLVRQHRGFLCGAVLIDEQWALTAAHCVYDSSAKHPDMRLSVPELSVVVGVNAHPDRAEEEFRHGVQQVLEHPDYKGGKFDNDIALLKLARPITLSKTVGVACLPCSGSRLATGEVGVVTGWRAEANQIKELRFVQLTVTDVDDCKQHFRNEGYISEAVTDNMFCTTSNSSTDDASFGDSGGPFVMQGEGGGYILEGIVSWGEEPESVENVDAGSRHSRPDNRSGLNAKNTRLSSTLDEGEAIDHDMTRSVHYKCPGGTCYGGYTRVEKYVQWIETKTNLKLCGNH